MPENATELLERPADEVTETAVTRGTEITVEPDEVVAADLLVEEISIDGMCGVY
jgi:mycofactocin precursor